MLRTHQSQWYDLNMLKLHNMSEELAEHIAFNDLIRRFAMGYQGEVHDAIPQNIKVEVVHENGAMCVLLQVTYPDVVPETQP